MLPVDLSNTSNMIMQVEETIKRVGPIDGMALVAGMINTLFLRFVKADLWEKIEKVNLYSTIELAKLDSKKGIKPAGLGGNYYSILLLRLSWDSSQRMLLCNKSRFDRRYKSIGNRIGTQGHSSK